MNDREAIQRKSYTSLGKIYFWTATIHNWRTLLEPDENKQLIIDSLKFLSDKDLPPWFVSHEPKTQLPSNTQNISLRNPNSSIPVA